MDCSFAENDQGSADGEGTVASIRSDKMCFTMLVTSETTASVTMIFMTSITKRVISAYTRVEQHIHFWIGEFVGQ